MYMTLKRFLKTTSMIVKCTLCQGQFKKRTS